MSDSEEVVDGADAGAAATVDAFISGVVNPTQQSVAAMSDHEVAVQYLSELKELLTKTSVAMMQGLNDLQRSIVESEGNSSEFSNALIKFVIEGKGEQVRYQLEFKGELARGIATLFNLESLE